MGQCEALSCLFPLIPATSRGRSAPVRVGLKAPLGERIEMFEVILPASAGAWRAHFQFLSK